MRHRIFIAINLPEDIKKQISYYQKKWLELPCRWTKKENLHITLIFLGYLTDEEILDIIKITREAVFRHRPFTINLNKIIYGPPKKPPRMVWVEGEKSQELANLQNDLENFLYNNESIRVAKKREIRPYSPHITLGRIKTWEFRQIEKEERPEINENISLVFPVESIEIMESQLKRTGPEYSILELCPLKID
jgi:2'-5' RNA ligase